MSVTDDLEIHRLRAESRFEEARRQALFEDLISLLTHRDRYPLAYEEIRRELRDYSEIDRGIQMIPLHKIVGSVGRYRDFTRTFLPRRSQVRERWKRLDAALNRLEIWPPIEVYQIGDRYIVRDGNHRVSVARANNLPEIEAHVVEIRPATPLDLDRPITPQLLAYEKQRFLDRTNIHHLCPGLDLEVTELGSYDTLYEHIQVHRWYMGQAHGRAVSLEEAVQNWCHDIYRPLVRLISRLDLLRHFPTRTPTDLYIWLSRHLHYLRQEYGDEFPAEAAAEDFKERFAVRPARAFFKELAATALKFLPGLATSDGGR